MTDLARWQFATTNIYHFLFVPVTIGLAFLTAVLQTTWHRSGNPELRRLTAALFVFAPVSNSSSAKYALTVMTVVAVLFLPLVLLYQGWSYHVFRARVGRAKAPADPQPPAAAPTAEPAG